MLVHRRQLRSAAAVPGLRFARLLGTGRGESFTPRDADPRHWALLASWDTAHAAERFESHPVIRAWGAHSVERWRLRLRPLASKGLWARGEPFGPAAVPAAPAIRSPGPYAVLTRARLVARQAVRFWKAVPPVAEALTRAEGLRFARGIGEAPVGLQATFSVWDGLDASAAFAYGTPEHRAVIARTAQTGWYAEQLFARFAVLDAQGLVEGRDPLASRDTRSPTGRLTEGNGNGELAT
jgi:hypothetical protein